jgi:hypothetical protein
MEGQLLNVMFEKKTKVVKVASKSGADYIVPLNTSLQFSPLYNPHNKLESAKKGFVFPKVVDLINLTLSPKIVAVTKSFTCQCNGGNVQIMEGDMLVLQEVIPQGNAKKLKCLIMKTQTVVLLDENLEGDFSTSIGLLKMSFQDLIQHVQGPIDATVSNSIDGKIQLPFHAAVDVYTLQEQYEEKSVIATTKAGDHYEIIEILLSVPIDVQLVNASEHQLHVLREEAQDMYKQFHPSKLDKIVVDCNSSLNFIQSTLFKVVVSDDSWMCGIELLPPQPPSASFQMNIHDDDDDGEYIDMSLTSSGAKIYEPVIPNFIHPIMLSSSEPNSPLVVEKFKTLTPKASKRPPMAIPHSHSDHNFVSSSEMRSDADPVPYMIVKEGKAGQLKHEKPYEYVRFAHNKNVAPIYQREEMTSPADDSETDDYEESVDLPMNLGRAINPPAESSTNLYTYSNVTIENNKRDVERCTPEQVIKILESLGLDRYKDQFITEQIDGHLLLSLTDEILEHELDIKSKIHRIKIMRVISGKQSIADYITTHDN